MALKLLRDNLKHLKFVLWGVIIVFIALVFVDWGSGGRTGGMSAAAAVRVGDRVVTEEEFRNRVRSAQAFYERQLGDAWEQFQGRIDLGQETVSRVIAESILLDEAERIGLVVSDEELQQAILDIPGMREQLEGLDRESRVQSYDRIIRRMTGAPPQVFEKGVRDQLMLEKLSRTIQQGVWVSDDDVVETLRRERESADADLVQVRFERFLSEVEVPPEEIRAYYDDHLGEFERDEERVIRYLVVETSRIRRQLEADTEALMAYYEDHREDYLRGEQMSARHILFRVAPGADQNTENAVKLKADQVARLAREGADFAELARIHTEDEGSREGGGDLGWFGRDAMVPEFEQAVFGAKPGDIVGPVKSQFGFHVIKVEGYRPEQIQPFEEVEEQVRFQFLEGRAAAEAETRATQLAKRVVSEEPSTQEEWQAIADEDEVVSLNQSPPVTAGSLVPGAGSDLAFTNEIFEADVLEIGGPKAIPRGWIVWQLSEVTPAGIPDFDVVREEVEQKVRRSAASERARQAATDLAASWRDGGDAEALAADLGSSVVEVDAHRRGSAWSTLGVLPAVDEAVYSAEPGVVVGPIAVADRGSVVARVDALQRLTDADIAAEREQIRARLMGERANRLLEALVADRQREVAVTVDREFVGQFSPQSQG
jgi:peptidyl-prolyl cis-trans isomerase D